MVWSIQQRQYHERAITPYVKVADVNLEAASYGADIAARELRQIYEQQLYTMTKEGRMFVDKDTAEEAKQILVQKIEYGIREHHGNLQASDNQSSIRNSLDRVKDYLARYGYHLELENRFLEKEESWYLTGFVRQVKEPQIVDLEKLTFPAIGRQRISSERSQTAEVTDNTRNQLVPVYFVKKELVGEFTEFLSTFKDGKNRGKQSPEESDRQYMSTPYINDNGNVVSYVFQDAIERALTKGGVEGNQDQASASLEQFLTYYQVGIRFLSGVLSKGDFVHPAPNYTHSGIPLSPDGVVKAFGILFAIEHTHQFSPAVLQLANEYNPEERRSYLSHLINSNLAKLEEKNIIYGARSFGKSLYQYLRDNPEVDRVVAEEMAKYLRSELGPTINMLGKRL